MTQVQKSLGIHPSQAGPYRTMVNSLLREKQLMLEQTNPQNKIERLQNEYWFQKDDEPSKGKS